MLCTNPVPFIFRWPFILVMFCRCKCPNLPHFVTRAGNICLFSAQKYRPLNGSGTCVSYHCWAYVMGTNFRIDRTKSCHFTSTKGRLGALHWTLKTSLSGIPSQLLQHLGMTISAFMFDNLVTGQESSREYLPRHASPQWVEKVVFLEQMIRLRKRMKISYI